MKQNRLSFSITTVLLLLAFSASAVFSADFIDTFDDPSFTSSNWTTYPTGAQQTWDHTMISGTDSGYHASAAEASPPAAKLADSGAEYDNMELVIETLLRIDSHPGYHTSENTAGVAFSVSQNSGYTAAIEQDYEGETDILFSLGIVEGDVVTEMPVDINFDTFYKLVVHMDATMQITAWLFSLDGTLMGTLSMGNTLSLQRGSVAIYGGPEVTFNNFKINDSGSLPYQTSIVVLTNASPDHTVSSGNSEQVYGTSASNQIILEKGARAELINFPGQNSIQIQSGSNLFTVYRSGTYVTFQGAEGTFLKIPTTLANQSISFNGEENRTLQIHNNQVMLDDQIVLTNHEPISQTGTDIPWPMHRHDARNTGRSPYAGPSNPVEKWRFMLPSTVTNASPVIGTDGTIYIGNGQSGSGGIFAVNPDGSQKWIYPGHTGDCAPAISADGTIYMTGYSDFHAVNPNGSEKWTFWTQNPFNYSSPCIGQDGVIYVGSGIDLLAISPDGLLLWQYRVGEDINSKPAVAPDGTIYVRSRTDYLCAVNPDGSEKWRLEIGSATYGGGLSPVIADDGTIYTNGIAPYTRTDSDYTTDVNSLFAINPDGTTKWIFNAISPAGTGTGGFDPALDSAGNLYLGGKVNDMWSTDAIFSLDASGNLLWTYQLPLTDYIGKSAPLVDVNGVIYFGATNKLYALTPQGGLKWTLETKINGSSPAMGSDGTLYFGTEDGYLNAAVQQGM
jgi:hypothetical protein